MVPRRLDHSNTPLPPPRPFRQSSKPAHCNRAKYYLIQQSVGADGTVKLPAPDLTGSAAMSATVGKGVLRNAAISTVDRVGYGRTANESEGTQTRDRSNTIAALRARNGCQDTDNNSKDFALAAAVNCAAPHQLRNARPRPGKPLHQGGTSGIVTYRRTNGFYPQMPQSDPNSSSSILVITQSPPPAIAQPGASLEVEADVVEFRPAADPQSAPLTFVPNKTAVAKQFRLTVADLAWKQQLPTLRKRLPVTAPHLLLSPEEALARLLTTNEVTLTPSLSILAELRNACPHLIATSRSSPSPLSRPLNVPPTSTSRSVPPASYTSQRTPPSTIANRHSPASPFQTAPFVSSNPTARASEPTSSSPAPAAPPHSGEGTIGLARGFLHPGARRLIASPWSVDGQATARLMEDFYTEFFRSKPTRSAALHAAQETLRAEPRWPHPAYWSGFLLQGDWR